MAGLLIYLLLKLVLWDTLPGHYQFAIKDWVLIVKLLKKQVKSLSCISMKTSFYIWLARNSSGWSSNISLITIEDANCPAASSKNTNSSRDSRSSNTAPLSSQPTRDHRKCDSALNTLAFSTKETLVMQTQFYKLGVQPIILVSITF